VPLIVIVRAFRCLCRGDAVIKNQYAVLPPTWTRSREGPIAGRQHRDCGTAEDLLQGTQTSVLALKPDGFVSPVT
jgi:hypothetical protein